MRTRSHGSPCSHTCTFTRGGNASRPDTRLLVAVAVAVVLGMKYTLRHACGRSIRGTYCICMRAHTHKLERARMLFTRFPPHHSTVFWGVRLACARTRALARAERKRSAARTRAAHVPPCDSLLGVHNILRWSWRVARSRVHSMWQPYCGKTSGGGGGSWKREAVSLPWRYGYAV